MCCVMVLMVFGWVCIEFGGFDVCLIIDESVLSFVDVLFVKWVWFGFEYFDYLGCMVLW